MYAMMDWKKYIFVLLITVAIFATSLYASNYFNNRRINELRDIEDKISTDILSLETQFDLLEEVSCEDFKDTPVLTPELNALAARLNYTEDQLGSNNDEVVRLKRIYSLLLIKDSLLSKRIATECKTNPVSIMYFYSNKGDCEDCKKQGYVLTELQQRYPSLRIYAFDYNLDLSAIDSMKTIYKIESSLPSLVIEDKTYTGFKSVEDLEKLLPDTLKVASTTVATSTHASSTKKK